MCVLDFGILYITPERRVAIIGMPRVKAAIVGVKRRLLRWAANSAGERPGFRKRGGFVCLHLLRLFRLVLYLFA